MKLTQCFYKKIYCAPLLFPLLFPSNPNVDRYDLKGTYYTNFQLYIFILGLKKILIFLKLILYATPEVILCLKQAVLAPVSSTPPTYKSATSQKHTKEQHLMIVRLTACTTSSSCRCARQHMAAITYLGKYRCGILNLRNLLFIRPQMKQ